MRRGLMLAAAGLLFASPAATATPTGPTVAVFPSPGSHFATTTTQITFRGTPADQIGAITVTGSRSGNHTGIIKADSDGDGGSFLPTSPFWPGERVTVSTQLRILGAPRGTFHFGVEVPANPLPPPGKRRAVRYSAGSLQRFVSRPDLRPAAVRVLSRSPAASPGDIFLTPQNGPLQYGPMILNRQGSLLWFRPLPATQVAMDLRVQTYQGQPVLTWWQGWINAGVGHGEGVILDSHYDQLATVHAGNGVSADLHEFTITPQNTALITASRLVRLDASSIGGPKNGTVIDSVVQEIDIATGLVLFQWDSLDHVPLNASYSRDPGAAHPFDYFHANSVQEAPDGTLLVSARNTWAVYDIDPRSGRVIWQLGGKHPSFKMLPGTNPAYQHHAQLYPGGLLSMFDDGAAPPVHHQSRALVERIEFRRRRVRLVLQLDHHPPLLTGFEGSMQRLTNGDWFVGWGQRPYFTEYDAQGRQIFDARFVANVASYRAYRFAWTGQPNTPPTLVLRRGAHGTTDAYVSWNGATDVAAWRAEGGPSPATLSPIATVLRNGFETRIRLRRHPAYVAVQALSASGAVLATSSTEAGSAAG